MGPISGGPINFAFARLRHASLRFATLTGANLEMADLSDADLSDARLDGANLSGADLSEAVLDRADFAGAKFGGVNLSGTRLSEARNLTQAQIDEALGDALTILPDHLRRPEGWGGPISQVVSSHRIQNASVSPNGKAAPSRGDSVSWLVGGPRRSNGHAASREGLPEGS